MIRCTTGATAAWVGAESSSDDPAYAVIIAGATGHNKDMPAPRRRPGHVSLDRALSKLGLASRTEARDLIRKGRVKLHGIVMEDPAHQVVPERGTIVVDDTVAEPRAWRLIAFHKPRRTVTSRRDPEKRTTVFDVLGETGTGLIAVGRLDYASTGLLLFTTDTQLANRLTDPANTIPRRYVVTVRGKVDDDTARTLEAGIDVKTAHGVERLAATTIEIKKASNRESHVIVTLNEGKNREIRRLFDAAGHEVTRLLRVSFGPIELGQLKPGEWRDVEQAELTESLVRVS
jgi:23S rRNA pseudouridine2605 synthase